MKFALLLLYCGCSASDRSCVPGKVLNPAHSAPAPAPAPVSASPGAHLPTRRAVGEPNATHPVSDRTAAIRPVAMGRDTIRPVAMGFFAATNIYIMYQGTYQPPTQFSVFPPVIKNLLILNGLVFMAQIVPSTNAMLITWFGLWPLGEPPIIGQGQFWPWQLVTYGFLHGGFSHILFNMFALWMFGVQIENTWGSQRFAVFYFATVIGAALLQLIVATTSPGWYPTVGASGGVFGLLLAFGMMFPNQPIYIYFLFPIKAKWFVVGYGLVELVGGVSGSSTVAHFAHLGGMFFGFLLIQYWRGKLPIKPAQRMYW